MNPKVSLVIPVYKVSKFIERCSRSLFEQSFRDIEYIFVNDCTPDNSIEILERVLLEYPERKTHTTLLHHNRNRGLGAARNTGFQASTCEYVLHVDSDDYLALNMVELMYLKAIESDSDIVVCDFFVQWNYVKKLFRQPYSTDSREYTNMLLCSQAMPCVWNKMIRKKLYTDYDIYPMEGIDMAEDFALTPRLAYYANSISKVESPLYHYVQTNQNAYTRKYSLRALNSLRQSIETLVSFFEGVKDKKLYEESLLRGILQKKLTMLESSDWTLVKEIAGLYPETDNIPLQYFTLHERIVLYLSRKKLFFLLRGFSGIYHTILELIQYLKCRKF
jgi:glycosyltransferase involved in cell wall biosynthesis